MSFFSNAQGFSISDGSFTNVAGDLNYNFHPRGGKGEDQDSPGQGIKILSENIVAGAAHDAEQRFPPPNCYPGTRIQILEIVRNWVNDSTKPAPIYWLYGAAGVGKSAVAQTISEEFVNNRLAASFFFSRADPTRNNLQRFFTTLSLQLATSQVLGPLLRNFIDLTIRHTLNIIYANLELQFEELILKPCNQLTAEQWKELPRLIVIDGLDECLDIASQERLLSIIRKAKSGSICEDESTGEAKTRLILPFEFLICSRPEPRIRNAFNHQDFRTIVARCDLGDAFESGKDIARYFSEEFSRIRRDHGQSMAHVPQDWPSESIVQLLVQRACGQFIYAATVLKYVGDYHGLPTERLEIILNITVPDDFDSPYPDLDLLYLQILSMCKQKELLLDVLAHLLRPGPNIFWIPQCGRTTSRCIEGLFFLAEGKVWTLLFGLHSVLNIPDNDHDSITVRHASFDEFLSDEKRSGTYYVNKSVEARHEQIAFYLLKRIAFSIKDDQNLKLMNSEFDIYAWHCWYFHCERVHQLPSSRFLKALLDFDITSFLNAAAKRWNVSFEECVLSLQACFNGLSSIANWAKVTRRVFLHQRPEHTRQLDTLAKQYSLFERGFRVVIVPTLEETDRKRLMMAILIFKYDLCLIQSNKRALISAFLDDQISPAQAKGVLSSPWSCPPILPLDQISSGPDKFRSGLYSDTVTIEFAEYHKRIGLQCLRILQEPSQSAKDVVDYAKCWWISHLVKHPHSQASEQTKIFKALMQNLSSIPTIEDAKKAIAWVENTKYAGQIKALHERLLELEDKEEEKKTGPKGKWTNKLFYRFKIR
ncbi:hypothetical protein GYMLUDRAFT_42386 [Collybiopsis luxurians FD-317 M1]|uniref:Nephrocystin 3-like N-terminal domain-containing protein n=1 Tax=Collybiopsis luxurians FD-317 M1 TaxID=944289 RepID=A0A0D0BDY5_9AGAR|nr:hypothetical protein GYMLUDRAFT_42386 [Collybiopsis luxurians FD-317 M1]